MRLLISISLLLTLQLSSGHALAEKVRVSALQFWDSEKQSRMMIDVSAFPKHSITLYKEPDRLVIDIENAQLDGKLAQPPASHPFFTAIRTGQKKDSLRIVADLKRKIKFESFLLEANKMYGRRLAVDIIDKGALTDSAVAAKAPSKTAKNPTTAAVERKTPAAVSAKAPAPAAQPVSPGRNGGHFVVAIDAGHGGEDPGAHGPGGTEEKRVVLAIAKKLASLINAQRGMRAVLVRKNDYFINLRKRMDIARNANADLFVSVHADAFQSANVKGASVFMLSNTGASSEAAHWLADRENASDLIGGVKLNDKEGVLASVLLDLSQSATLEASYNVAEHVLKSFQQVGELHFSDVQKAGFAVLKSPDIPSILVETAFISNPGEERKLNSTAHQDKIARAIFKGVQNYVKQFSPNGTRVAGDTRLPESGL